MCLGPCVKTYSFLFVYCDGGALSTGAALSLRLASGVPYATRPNAVIEIIPHNSLKLAGFYEKYLSLCARLRRLES